MTTRATPEPAIRVRGLEKSHEMPNASRWKPMTKNSGGVCR
ncbi:hypothetical protein AB0L13_09555 [Saccharopolyspora shandongensis]